MTDEERTVPEAEAKGSVTLSIRLTDRQKELLTQAATLKNWTVATLLKTAALEKAAHIVNTGTPRKVEFKGVARVIAEQVFEERSATTLDREGEPVVMDIFETESEMAEASENLDYPVAVSPWHMPPDYVDQIEQAAKFGGTEFLNLLVQACRERLTTRAGERLPDPIDPGAI